jgi:hypothetical protein
VGLTLVFNSCDLLWLRVDELGRLRAKLDSSLLIIVASSISTSVSISITTTLFSEAATIIVIVSTSLTSVLASVIRSSVQLAGFPFGLLACLVFFLATRLFLVVLPGGQVGVLFKLLLRQQEVNLHFLVRLGKHVLFVYADHVVEVAG